MNRKIWKADQVANKVYNDLSSVLSEENKYVLLERINESELKLTFNKDFKREKSFIISVKEIGVKI